jgi:hypothetical protein
MKTLALQLVTVGLENGQRGVFVGWPLISEDSDNTHIQIQDIWFSDIQDIPDGLTLEQLMKLVREQLCKCESHVQ